MRRWRCQIGQTSAEFLGGLVVVSVLIAALATSDVGTRIRDSIDEVVCRIAGLSCDPADTSDAQDAEPADVERAADDLADLIAGEPSPEQVAEFFESLDPDVAQALAEQRPELVGNLDGAPLRLRFTANAENVDRAIATVEEALANTDNEFVRRLLEERLAKLREFDDPDRRFLVFDPSGDGRVAEVFGPIETARHVAIVVPGMDNELSNYSGGNASRLQREAAALTDDGVATIQWLGYDTPEGLSGTRQDAANDGARRLAPFLEGIRVQRPGDDPHVTIVGHSYGSVVLGKSLKNEGLDIADAVAVGSPGMSVNDADDLGDGFDRLWAGRARGDVVGNAPFHGEDPHDVGFGATRFHTGDISGHSSYFNEGSLSLHNLGLIVAGRPNDVDVIE